MQFQGHWQQLQDDMLEIQLHIRTRMAQPNGLELSRSIGGPLPFPISLIYFFVDEIKFGKLTWRFAL